MWQKELPYRRVCFCFSHTCTNVTLFPSCILCEGRFLKGSQPEDRHWCLKYRTHVNYFFYQSHFIIKHFISGGSWTISHQQGNWECVVLIVCELYSNYHSVNETQLNTDSVKWATFTLYLTNASNIVIVTLVQMKSEDVWSCTYSIEHFPSSVLSIIWCFHDAASFWILDTFCAQKYRIDTSLADDDSRQQLNSHVDYIWHDLQQL